MVSPGDRRTESMAFANSTALYRCADCKEQFKAMKLYPATWEDLAYDVPMNIKEARGKEAAQGQPGYCYQDGPQSQERIASDASMPAE